MTYNEATKKSQGDDSDEITEQPILLAQKDSHHCPVKGYKLYISKLSDKIDAFF